MKVVRCALFAVLLLGVSQASRAAEVPGASDPELRAAVQAWLDDDDPRQAMWAIGELAADGNVAARVLVNEVRWSLGRDFPEMDLEARRALLPPDRTGPKRGFKPYPVDRSVSASSYVLSQGMFTETTSEAWIAGARALLAAGYRNYFQWLVVRVPSNRPEIDVEAIRFAETVFNPADWVHATFWHARRRESEMLAYLDRTEPSEAAARRARWGGDSWTPEIEAAFAEALREERWSAILAAGVLFRFGTSDLPLDAETADLYRGWSIQARPNISNTTDADRLNRRELEMFGSMLLRDAERSAYLRPIRGVCDALCPENRLLCMAGAAPVLHGFPQLVPRSIEPVLGAAAYYSSPRAARDALFGIGYRIDRGNHVPDWATVPQCLRDPAVAEHARVTGRLR
ncbi:MAG: hypothetical protein AAGE83_12005 [Pseudomonadota bacterium]